MQTDFSWGGLFTSVAGGVGACDKRAWEVSTWLGCMVPIT